MEFHSYEKMPERLSSLNLDLQETKKLDKATWVLTEKVHGANFSFILNREGISYAKRKEPLSWEDDFFGFQRVAERLQSALFQLFDLLSEKHTFDVAQLYGELFGGAYPHPDIPKIEALQAIQTGVYYSPDIEFCAFDLALINLEGDRTYIPYSELIEYCEAAGIFYAKPLYTGTLQQVLNFDIHISSTLPEQLGLAPLPNFNLIEGVVIKPMNNLVVETKKGPIRPILKVKNPEFSEDGSYLESKKWSYQIESDEDAILFYVDELGKFLNPNRLQAVISKIGHPNTIARREQVRQSLWEDILESYEEHNVSIEPVLLTALKIAFWPLLRTFIEETIQTPTL